MGMMSFWSLFVLVTKDEKEFLQKTARIKEERFKKFEKKYGIVLYLQEFKALKSFRLQKKLKQEVEDENRNVIRSN